MCVCNSKMLLGSVGEPRGCNCTETRRAALCEKNWPGAMLKPLVTDGPRPSYFVHSCQVRHLGNR